MDIEDFDSVSQLADTYNMTEEQAATLFMYIHYVAKKNGITFDDAKKDIEHDHVYDKITNAYSLEELERIKNDYEASSSFDLPSERVDTPVDTLVNRFGLTRDEALTLVDVANVRAEETGDTFEGVLKLIEDRSFISKIPESKTERLLQQSMRILWAKGGTKSFDDHKNAIFDNFVERGFDSNVALEMTNSVEDLLDEDTTMSVSDAVFDTLRRYGDDIGDNHKEALDSYFDLYTNMEGVVDASCQAIRACHDKTIFSINELDRIWVSVGGEPKHLGSSNESQQQSENSLWDFDSRDISNDGNTTISSSIKRREWYCIQLSKNNTKRETLVTRLFCTALEKKLGIFKREMLISPINVPSPNLPVQQFQEQLQQNIIQDKQLLEQVEWQRIEKKRSPLCVDTSNILDCTEQSATIIQLSKTQNFLARYFTPENPFKGIVVWSSVGSGKTCAAISTASKSWLPLGWAVLYVTKHNLIGDIWKNIVKDICADAVVDLVKSRKWPTSETSGKESLRNIQINAFRAAEPNFLPPVSYATLGNMTHRVLMNVKTVRDLKNVVVAPGSPYRPLIEFAKDRVKHDDDNSVADPFKNVLFIIDEAHKLVIDPGVEMKGREAILTEHQVAFREMLHRSYKVSGNDSCRSMLLTATPIKNSPVDFMRLLNLLQQKPSQYLPHTEDEYNEFLNLSDELNEDAIEQIRNSAKGVVSYLDVSGDNSKFASVRENNTTVVTLNTVMTENAIKCLRSVRTEGETLKETLERRGQQARTSLSNCILKSGNFRWSGREPTKYRFWESKNITARNVSEYRRDVEQLSPKLVALLTNIVAIDKKDARSGRGLRKHVIYIDSKDIMSLASGLIAFGFNWIQSVNSSTGLILKKRIKKTNFNFALLTRGPTPLRFQLSKVRDSLVGSLPSACELMDEREDIESGTWIPERGLFNERRANRDGKLCRFLVYDEDNMEAVDMYDVSYIHLFQKLTSPFDMKQVIGRSTRTCGQRGIRFTNSRDPLEHGWPLKLYQYRSEFPRHTLISEKHAGPFELAVRATVNVPDLLASFTMLNTVADVAVDGFLNANINPRQILPLQSGVKKATRDLNVIEVDKKDLLV